LDKQVREQEKWKHDAERLEDIKIQQERTILDLQGECSKRDIGIASDKKYISDLERRISDANMSVEGHKNDLRSQDDHINQKERHIQDLERDIDRLTNENMELRTKVEDIAVVSEQLRRNHDNGVRAQAQLTHMQNNFQRIVQNSEDLKRDYGVRINELTDMVR
jgi:chromosome segregation ATPase